MEVKAVIVQFEHWVIDEVRTNTYAQITCLVNDTDKDKIPVFALPAGVKVTILTSDGVYQV